MSDTIADGPARRSVAIASRIGAALQQPGRRQAIAGLVAVAACACASLGLHPLAGLALALLPLAAIGVIAAPVAICLGFVVFSFFRLHEVFPALMPLRLPQLLALAALAGLVWHVAAGQVRLVWNPSLTWFVAFAVLVTLGLPFSSSRPTSIAMWTETYVKIVIMVFAIAVLFRAPRHFALASRAFVAAGALVACVALANAAAGIGLVEGTRVTIGRDIGSQLGDPNDLGLVLLFPASFSVGLAATAGNGRMWRLFGALAFLLIVGAVLETQSRGALLGLVAIMGLLGLRLIRSKLALLVAGFLAISVLFAVAGIAERQSGGAAEEGIDESAMGRLYAWGAAWRMGLSHPLTGIGMDAFHDNYYAYSSHWDGKNHAVHSTWFQILAETGFPGFFCFVGMVVTLAREQRRLLSALDAPASPVTGSAHVQRNSAFRACAFGLAAGLAGFCAAGSFLTMGYTWPLYVILALTAALAAAARR